MFWTISAGVVAAKAGTEKAARAAVAIVRKLTIFDKDIEVALGSELFEDEECEDEEA